MTSCKGVCNNGMTSLLTIGKVGSKEEDVMLRRLSFYYHSHMIPGIFMGRFFDCFKYRS